MKKFIFFILLIGSLTLMGCSQTVDVNTNSNNQLPIAERDRPYMNLPKTDAQLADPTLAIPMCADACDKEGLDLEADPEAMTLCLDRCVITGTNTPNGTFVDNNLDFLTPLPRIE